MRILPISLGYITATILTVLAAFFGVMNVLFSDRSGPADILVAAIYIFILYFIWSFLLHWLWRSDRLIWIYWLIVPAMAVTVLMIIGDGLSLILLGFLILLLVIIGTWLGRIVIRRKAF